MYIQILRDNPATRENKFADVMGSGKTKKQETERAHDHTMATDA